MGELVIGVNAPPPFTDFGQDTPRNEVSGRKVFGRGSVPLHKGFAVLVPQYAAFTTQGLTGKDSRAHNPCWMELHGL